MTGLRSATVCGSLLFVAACGRVDHASGGNGADVAHQPGDNQSIVRPAAKDQDADRPSILRPEVVSVVEPEPLKPETLTLPFGFNGNALDESARTALDKLVESEVMAAGGAITIRGHTDSRGFDVDNRRVSLKRAEAVRDYLIGRGISPGRITTIGLGEARPIAPNAKLDGSDDPEGRTRNRRVEIEITISEDVPSPPSSKTPQE